MDFELWWLLPIPALFFGLGWIAARIDIKQHSQLVSASIFKSCYSAPEQYTPNAKHYGPWTDMYGLALGPMSYCAVNGMLDAAYPRGALNYWKSSFLSELSDSAIDTMIAAFARCPTPMGNCCSSASTER